MTAKIQEVTIDCADAARLAEFWGKVLDRPWGYRPAPGGVVDAGGIHLFFQVVPEPKSSPKNRLHLDVEVDDVPAAVAKAEAMGATKLGGFHDEGEDGGFQVMQDPEGNEFCFVTQQNGSWTGLLDEIAGARG
ncbi:MAG: VOC family protein [Propionibacteriaceae bacterium]|jgi:predicted enzyme related to lactoylglutathione lyase|nr:VOC family protein [Propionibacteriaceae bacterium]